MEAKEEGSSLGGHSGSELVIIVKLVARLLCFTFTLISLVPLGIPIFISRNDLIINNGLLYRYALLSAILGLVYSLLQISVSVYNLGSGNGNSNNLVPLDLYGDLVILYALATGAVAVAVAATDFRAEGNTPYAYMDGSSISNAAAASLLLGSIYSAISLALSTYDLYKRYFTRRYE